MPWVCLRVIKHIRKKGQLITYRPGDWVEVGRQTAEGWLAAGAAYAVDASALDSIAPTSGAYVYRSRLSEEWRNQLEQGASLKIAFGDSLPDGVPFNETMLWLPDKEIRLDLIQAGFRLLNKFQIAVPLQSGNRLISEVAVGEEADAMKEQMHDLRIPLRATHLVFLRRCDATRSLMALWNEEIKRFDGDRDLAFMRAFYAVKPVVCDLPATWAGGRHD